MFENVKHSIPAADLKEREREKENLTPCEHFVVFNEIAVSVDHYTLIN